MKKYTWMILVAAALAAGIFILPGRQYLESVSCKASYRNDVTVHVGSSVITAEEATTPVAQAKGLGDKSCIGSNQGMLFVFNKPGYYPFWMKDMKFPIDIIWINSAHQVVTIYPNVAPSTFPKSFTNSAPAEYVLELRANQAGVDKIQQGTTVSF